MDELFRFTLIRPPQSTDDVCVPIADSGSDLQGKLTQATSPQHRRLIAREWRGLATIFQRFEELTSHPAIVALAARFLALAPDAGVTEIAAAVTSVVTGPLEGIFDERQRYRDTFLSYVLAPSPDGPSLPEVARALRTLQVVEAYWQQAPMLSVPGMVLRIMNAPILLPPVALATSATHPWPVGFADLLTVKQHIQRYDRGEISRLENVLRGETRKHTRKHTLSTEVETSLEREQFQERTEEVSVTERSKLTSEIEKSLKETWNVKAGLEVGYGNAPSFFIRANAGFTYDRISEESARYATELAKEITTKASSKVSERIKQVERRKVIEAFEDTDEQSFTAATANVAGVYQFLDKVYRCRIYSYDKRWLFDFVVPEPAAFLLSAGKAPLPAGAPIKPKDLTVDGTDAADDESNLLTPARELEKPGGPYDYTKYVARYGVSGIEPPPPTTTQVSKAILGKADTALAAIEIQIPEGYVASNVMSLGMWNGASDSAIALYAGDVPLSTFSLSTDGNKSRQGGPYYATFSGGGSDLVHTIGSVLPVSLLPYGGVTDYVLNIVVNCTVRDEVLERWRQATFDRILARYQQLMKEYEDRLAASGFSEPTKTLGRNPEINRLTERLELKKAVIGVLAGAPVEGFAHITVPPTTTPPTPPNPALPAPDFSGTFEEDMAHVRFMEQAFEWENLTYALYPYFWGRSSEWRDRLGRREDDPMFENFLRAGAARVVLAVRPGFAEDVFYYLATGLVWQGSSVPVIGDPRYVPIVDELRQQAGAIVGTPVGTDWELRVASDLVQLRDDDSLPKWKEVAPPPDPTTRTWHWTEIPKP